MEIVQGDTITAGATTAQVILFKDIDKGADIVVFFTPLTGTFKLGRNAIPGTAKAWTSDDTVPPFTCKNGDLFFQANSNADTFSASAVVNK